MKKSILAISTLILLVLAWQIASSFSQPAGKVEVTADSPPEKGWKTETVLTGLEHPWSVVWLPDGSMLISERSGNIRRATNNKLQQEPVSGVPEVYAQGQGGLLDLALHPNFKQNHLLYFTYSAGTSSANATTLARAEFRENTLNNVEVLFQVPTKKQGAQHFGSRLLWLPDGTLLMTIGDGGNPPSSYEGELTRNLAPKKNFYFGKVLRLTEEGKAPNDNPFVNESGALPEVWSYGHRNAQGITIDPETKTVYSNEHGSRGGDELNIIERGKNYGWPEVTYSNEYWGPKISEVTSRADVQDPLIVWTPSKAPSGLAFYTGDIFPEWRGDLFSGALKYQHVRRIDLEQGKVVKQRTLDIGARVRDVRQGPDGYLYVLTDEADGKLLRIVPSKT